MRNDVFCADSSRLNAPGGLREGLEGAQATLESTNPQNPQRERKKEAKKERESTTATIFVSKTGNYNCRQREIIIDARQNLGKCSNHLMYFVYGILRSFV